MHDHQQQIATDTFRSNKPRREALEVHSQYRYGSRESNPSSHQSDGVVGVLGGSLHGDGTVKSHS